MQDDPAPRDGGLEAGRAGAARRPAGDRTVRSASFLVGANLAVRVLGVVNVAIVARLLTPEDYGVMALAVTVLGLAHVLSEFQVNDALIRTPRVDRAHFDTAFALTILRGSCAAAAIVAAAGPAAAFFQQPALAEVLLWIALAPLIDGLRNPYFVRFAREIDFARESVVVVGARLSSILVAIGLALLWGDYWALVAGAIASSAVGTTLTHLFARRLPGLSLARWREFVGFGLWLTAANVVDYVNNRSDAVIVGRGLGPGPLGQYSMGQYMATMATSDLAKPMTRVVYAGLASVQAEPARFRAAYSKAQSTILGVVLPVGVGASLTAEELVRVLLGQQWIATVDVLRILTPVMALGMLSAGAQAVVMVSGETRRLFLRNVANFAIRVPTLMLGMWLGGLTGLIWARVFTGLAQTVVTLQMVRGVTGQGFAAPVLASWRSLVACAVMAAVVAATAPAGPPVDFSAALAALVVKAAVGAPVFVGVHLGLWLWAGRPDGFETVMLAAVKRLGRRLR